MIRRPPRSTLFPYTTPLPISPIPPSLANAKANRDFTLCLGVTLICLLAACYVGGCCRALLYQAQAVEGCMIRADRKSTRLNSSHANISYAVFCLKKQTTAFKT